MNKQQLVDHLNNDLSKELSAMVQYLTYSAKVTGPYRPQLADFLLAEVPDEQQHAEFLANKIVALGGEPAVTIAPVPRATGNHAMLEAVLQAEREAINDYSERAMQAAEFGDKGLSVQLEDMVVDETRHAEEVERILRDWSLA